jgi:recombination protein RecT
MTSKNQPPSGQQQELGASAARPPVTNPSDQPKTEPAAGAEPGAPEKKLNPKQEAKNGATLMAFLDSNKGMIGEFTKGFMTPEAMFRMATLACARQPLLYRCTLSSILRALIDAATLRVRPGGLNGRGYLVPRKNNKVTPSVYEAHFDPGWRGLCDIARRSGVIKTIGAEAIRENDDFDFYYDPLPKLKWKRLRGGTEDRPITGAFAVALLTDGAIQIEVLESEDLAQIMNSSAAKDSGPWQDWKGEMARKSVVKRLCKYLPVPDDYDVMERALAASDSADTGDRIIDVPGETVSDGPSQVSRIKGELNAPGLSAMDQLAALEGEAAEVLASGESA